MVATLLSFMLLGLGLAGFIGTFLIERFIGGGLYRTLTVIPLIMAAIALAERDSLTRTGSVSSVLIFIVSRRTAEMTFVGATESSLGFIAYCEAHFAYTAVLFGQHRLRQAQTPLILVAQR